MLLEKLKVLASKNQFENASSNPARTISELKMSVATPQSFSGDQIHVNNTIQRL